MSEGGSRRCTDALIPVALKAELRRDQCALGLADSLRRLKVADVAARSIESCLQHMSSDLPQGVSIDPVLESLRRELRSRQRRELREVAGLTDRLRIEVDEARSTLLRAQGLCDAVNTLVRSCRRDAAQREARKSEVDIDDEWLRRPLAARSGAGR